MRIVLLPSLLMSLCAGAQCNLDVQITAFDAYCTGFTISYSITGGTPPYQVLAYNVNGPLIQTTTSNITGGGTFTGASWDVQLEVTDALGCFESDWSQASPMFHSYGEGYFEWSTDCTTGLTTLRLAATLICEPALLQYELHNLYPGQSANNDQGTFADDWIDEQNGYWRYGQSLPAGYYSVVLLPAQMTCDIAGLVWQQCWEWP
ncbi:MAG: hypothetical protein KDB88_12075, partial [Flavobacteriales bacterium]|nr:hypothetical protein [Flavobacteriales bacterium]